MLTFLRKFITGCANCQAAKVNTHPTVPRLSPLAVESPLPFSSILVDLITGLQVSHRFDSVMVVVDHGLSKGVIYCTCSKEIDAAGVAQLFFTHVFLESAYTPRSYLIVVPSLPLPSPENWQDSSNTTLHCQLHITHKLMERQNELTRNWKHISGCSPQTNLRNGHPCYPWQSLLTTPWLTQ